MSGLVLNQRRKADLPVHQTERWQFGSALTLVPHFRRRLSNGGKSLVQVRNRSSGRGGGSCRLAGTGGRLTPDRPSLGSQASIKGVVAFATALDEFPKSQPMADRLILPAYLRTWACRTAALTSTWHQQDRGPHGKPFGQRNVSPGRSMPGAWFSISSTSPAAASWQS